MHPLTQKLQAALALVLLLIVNFSPLHANIELRWNIWFVLLGMAITNLIDWLARTIGVKSGVRP